MTLNREVLKRALLIIDNEFPYVRKWVDHLLSNKGIPGFVQEFKNLKAWALQIIAGNCNFKVEWFKFCIFQGCKIPLRYKRLFQLIVMDTQSVEKSKVVAKRLRKYLSVLNIYHCAFGPSQSELYNQIETVKQKAVRPAKHESYLKLVRMACNAIRVHLPSQEGELAPTGQTVALFPGKNGSWGRFCVDVIMNKYGREYNILEFVTGIQYPELVDNWMDPVSKTDEALQFGDLSFMGNLTAIGESGGKTRLVLVGNPLVQCKLVPLKQGLLDLLRKIPTDCTFKQDEGIKWIQEMTLSGRKLYSVDLKDCTWNLPSSLQEEILIMAGVSDKIRNYLFRTKVHNPLTDGLMLIEKGQAMGLGPSFPLFSLFHNLVLFTFCLAKGVSPIKTFRVLGDDVVISDQDVYHQYRLFLKDYEVPISRNKTFISRSLGEFAGKVIWKGEDITPIKWKLMTWESISNLYWIYRNIFGSKHALAMLGTGRDRFALEVIKPIPKKLGGLGLKAGAHETGGVVSTRKGILEKILLRGKEGNSSGYPKIPQQDFECKLDHEYKFSREIYSRFIN
jgi:hypothetical protein